MCSFSMTLARPTDGFHCKKSQKTARCLKGAYSLNINAQGDHELRPLGMMLCSKVPEWLLFIYKSSRRFRSILLVW